MLVFLLVTLFLIAETLKTIPHYMEPILQSTHTVYLAQPGAEYNDASGPLSAAQEIDWRRIFSRILLYFYSRKWQHAESTQCNKTMRRSDFLR